jgi:hypothetical protein
MRLARFSSTNVAPLAAALGALLLVPGSSQAGDHKIFPGSFCQQATTDSTSLEYNYSLYGGVLQTEAPGGTEGGAGADFSCPILRDNEANTTGFKFYAWVNDFWGENGDDEIEQVVCSVGIRKSDGSGQLDWETRASGVEFTGMVKLDWGTSLATSEAFAVYYMDCFVPTYSGVHSYRTDEP